MSWNPSVLNLILAAAILAMAGLSIFAAFRTHLPWKRPRVWAMLAMRLVLLAALGAWCLEVRIPVEQSSSQFQLTVLADRSPSLSADGRAAVDDWIARLRQQGSPGGSPINVIDFGSPGGSGLAEALDKACGSFPGKGEKRVLVLSDGRATTGDVPPAGQRLKAAGVKAMATPMAPLEGESLIAAISVPSSAWRNATVPVEVTLHAAAAGACKLVLDIDGQVKQTRDLALVRGTNVVSMGAKMEADGLHALAVRATFAADVLDWNNTASAIVDVARAPRVLVVSEHLAGANPLEAALSSGGMVVKVVSPRNIPPDFAHDCIVIDNVPAEALGAARMKTMEQFVRDGGAMVFTGGARAFGAGGYLGSPLEAALPVMMVPKKEHPPYAMAVLLDNSWSMNEGVTSSVGKIDLAKEIAIIAMENLNRGDWLTFVSFDSDYHDIIAPTKVENLEPAKYEVSRIGAFGMTNILGGLNQAAGTLVAIDAAYKHIILISDGKETETGTDYSRFLAQLEKLKITLSTVAVGMNPDKKLMDTLAYAGKGRSYHAQGLAEVPAIVLQESQNQEDQLVALGPQSPKKVDDDPALAGLEIESMPPLTGYNRTRGRTHAWTPVTISPKKDPLLARMRYGRGQTLAFTSSVDAPWAKAWIAQKPSEYATFWKQAVLSVLGPPAGRLEASRRFEQDSPVFDVQLPEGGAAELAVIEAGLVRTTRLAAGLASGNATAPVTVTTNGSQAMLLTSRGAQIRSLGFGRSYGQEFGDAEAGRATLRQLADQTGGIFDPTIEQALAPASIKVERVIPPTAMLLVALAALVVDLLIRRLPAVGGLFRKRTLSMTNDQ